MSLYREQDTIYQIIKLSNYQSLNYHISYCMALVDLQHIKVIGIEHVTIFLFWSDGARQAGGSLGKVRWQAGGSLGKVRWQ